MNTNEKPLDLVEGILRPIANRISERKEYLQNLGRYRKNLGIEGWLKVETMDVLGENILKVQNKGADLLLKNGLEIELKGAVDFNISYIKSGALKYNSPCLFLGNCKDKNKIKRLESDNEIEMIGYEIINDGVNNWIIGMIQPSMTEQKIISPKNIQKNTSSISGNKAPQLHTVRSFNELKEVIRIRSLYYPTDYMDLLLLENKNKTLSMIVKEFRQYAETVNNNDFHTVSKLKNHIKYRESKGWIYNISGDRNDPIVILAGFDKT